MRKSKVLAKIRAGRVARIFCIGSPLGMAPSMAAHFHYDGIWVDAEHRVWDPSEVDTMIGRHHAADIDCIWRPPTKEKNALYRLLEDGATGLMIPHVSTPDQAQSLVQAMKFPPLGDRGYDGAGRDASFWFGAPKDYVAQANRETFLVAQIETQEALSNVDAIAAVAGVDVLFIGPGDLSLRLGCAPGVSDPIMMEAQKKVAAAANIHGKAWGRPVGTAEDAGTIIGMGAQFVVLGSEFVAMIQQMTACSGNFDDLLNEIGGTSASVHKASGKAY
jgi:4-hydroxy-2-oxoheptanedioate aldolase